MIEPECIMSIHGLMVKMLLSTNMPKFKYCKVFCMFFCKFWNLPKILGFFTALNKQKEVENVLP